MVGAENKLRILFRLALNRLFERNLSADATADELPGLDRNQGATSDSALSSQKE